jgi:tRNA (guanine-N7-)-methyltransferase
MDLNPHDPAAPTRSRDFRTFHPRRGRMTDNHHRELAELRTRYGLEPGGSETAVWVANARTARRAVILEIGFGLGDATAAMAAAQPDLDVVAVDVHTPGVLRLMRLVDEAGLSNVRVVEGDALELLDGLPSGCLAGIRAYFPDPWPKHSHRHRRLCAPANIILFVDRLQIGGTLHIATDIAAYAAEAETVLRAHDELDVERLSERPAWRASTKFERQGLAAGREIADLIATRRLPR